MASAAEKCVLQSDQSLRGYYREFHKVVEASDVVLEVLDARYPLGLPLPAGGAGCPQLRHQ